MFQNDNLTNPLMLLPITPQYFNPKQKWARICSDDALLDMEQAHCGICDIGLIWPPTLSYELELDFPGYGCFDTCWE